MLGRSYRSYAPRRPRAAGRVRSGTAKPRRQLDLLAHATALASAAPGRPFHCAEGDDGPLDAIMAAAEHGCTPDELPVLVDLLKGCLRFQCRDRLTAQEALEHAALRG
eukprot:6121558-Prymnesium_polylepis.1